MATDNKLELVVTVEVHKANRTRRPARRFKAACGVDSRRASRNNAPGVAAPPRRRSISFCAWRWFLLATRQQPIPCSENPTLFLPYFH